MTELLTESFCERCGTRYTFEATQRRRAGASRLRVLSLGLRTFIGNDDTSLSEAMAAARNDDERAIAAQQMDAFHRTFNFCFSCRQYICANCWNELAGTCLTCNPLEADRYEQPAPVEATPPIAELGTAAAQAFAPQGAAPPAVEGSATGGTGSDQSPQGAMEAAGPAPLLRPRLEAVAWPRTDVAAPGAGEGPADAEVAIAATAPEAPSANAPLAEAVDEEAAVDEASAVGGAPAEAVLAEATSADELTADELQTVREALGAVPGADSAATLAVEPEAVAEREAVAEHEAAVPAEQAAEPEAVAAAVPAEAAAEPEPATPLASAPPPPEPEAPVLGSRTPAPGRPGTFGRLRTGGLLNRYRPAASDRLHATRPAPVAAGGAEPADAATAAGAAIEAAQGELVPDIAAATLPEPSPDLPAGPAPAAAAEPAPPEAEPAPSRGPAGAEPPAATPATRDVVSQPVWSVVAPDTDEEPAQPWTPEPRPAPRPLDLPPSAWAARLATARPNDVWSISAQDVVTTQAGAPAPSVQPCVQCGLALSANARFCRRCGAGQR